jgi:hypothetical protein
MRNSGRNSLKLWALFDLIQRVTGIHDEMLGCKPMRQAGGAKHSAGKQRAQ